jgi:hypothetical protein
VAAEALTEAMHSKAPAINLQDLFDQSKTALELLSDIFEQQSEPAPNTVPLPRVPPWPPQPHNLWANAVLHPITGKAMEYRKLITDPDMKQPWLTSAANEY